MPANGTGSSTSALSVCTCTTIWSRVDVVADRDLPAHDLRFRHALAEVGQPEGQRISHYASNDASSAATTRAASGRHQSSTSGGAGRHVVRRDPADRRLQRVERLLLDRGDHLGAEAAGERRLVHDDHPSGTLRRRSRGLDVERRERAQVDDADVRAAPFLTTSAAATATWDHRAPRDDHRVVGLAHDARDDQRDEVLAVGHLVTTCGSSGMGSRTATGSGSRIALASSPLASAAVDGTDHLQPGRVRVRASTESAWCSGVRTPPP